VKESTKEMVTIKSYHDEKPRHTKNDDSGNDSVCDQLCDRADTHRPQQQSAQQREPCRKIQAHDSIWLSINAEPAHRALHLKIRLQPAIYFYFHGGSLPENGAGPQSFFGARITPSKNQYLYISAELTALVFHR
jgi:hypothetical protein